MPTGIGNGIAGDVFQNNLGAGGGGGLVCPSRYSWLGDGMGLGGPWGLMASGPYNLGATSSSASIWYKPIDIRGATNLGAGLYTTDAVGIFSTATNIYTSPSGVLTATLGPMIFPAHPELITNGSFTEVPVGAELIANPTFSDAASITPWNTTGAPNATLSWNARFMRMTYTVANGNALFDNMGQTLNTMYSVKMRVRGVTSAGADQGSAFDAIGDNTALTSANIISNPTLTSEYQDYEFRVWSTNVTFRFYLATAAIGDVVDFDSISVKPLDMLVDNGNFSSLGADWTVIDNTAGDTVTFGGSSATWTKTNPEAVYLQQDYPVTLGASHKLTYTILSNTYTGGGTELGLSSLSAYGQSPIPSSVGTHTVYLIVTLDTPDAALRFYSNDTGGSLEITNISVEELGEGWTLFSDVSVGEDKLICDNVAQNTSIASQSGVVPTEKSVKVSYDVVVDSGEFRLLLGSGGTTTVITTSGTYVFYETSGTGGNLVLQARSGGFDGSITNVSVEEVLSENEWHHLALSIDRDSEWKWYVDGVLTNTMDNATDVAPLLGASTLGLTNYSTAIASFYGNMTEPSLWNIPLSSSEVKDIYDNMYGGQRCLDILPFSSDLITNGNFSQIGPELVTNGDFSATGSELMPTIGTIVNAGGGSITLISGISYSSTSDGTSGSSIRPKIDLATTSSKSYKLVITPTSTPTGTTNCDFYDGSSYLFQDYDFTTTKEIYFVDNGSVFLSFDGAQIYDVPSFTISVKELGEDWGESGDSTISIGTHEGRTDVADINIGDTSTASRIYQSLTWTEGKTYKVTCEVYVVSGSFRIDVSNSLYASDIVQTSTTDSWQTLTGYMVALKDSTEQFWLRSSVEIAQFYVDSVSIQEVGQGWEAEGTGSGVVTFPNGMARIETVAAPNSAYIRQYSVMEVGKSYTMTYRIVSNNGGTLYNSGQTPTTMDSTVGSHSETFIAGSSNLLISRSGDNTDVSITNITLTQVGGGNLERWWRMNGLEPSLITLPNVAPNGTVDDCVPAGSPIIQLDTP